MADVDCHVNVESLHHFEASSLSGSNVFSLTLNNCQFWQMYESEALGSDDSDTSDTECCWERQSRVFRCTGIGQIKSLHTLIIQISENRSSRCSNPSYTPLLCLSWNSLICTVYGYYTSRRIAAALAWVIFCLDHTVPTWNWLTSTSNARIVLHLTPCNTLKSTYWSCTQVL